MIALKSALALAVAVMLCAWWTTAASAQGNEEGEAVRLRISWGGREPSRWVGRFALDNGSMSNLKLLGLAPDSAGSIWLERGRVIVATLSAHKEDAFEIKVPPSLNASLVIELSQNGAPAAAQQQVMLSDLSQQAYSLRLDDRGNTLRVELVASDRLQVATDRDPLIFAPGEHFHFEVQPTLADVVPGTTLDIRTTLLPARRNEILWSNDQRIEVPVEGRPHIPLNVTLPNSEGAYRIRVAAIRPPGFRERFLPGAATPLAERTFDVVVLNPRPQPPTASGKWESVLEIDPTSPRWWERLPTWTQLRRIPGLNRGPLGSIRAGAVDLPLGRFVELPPTAPSMEPHWQAYSLPLEAIGTPHLLEIEYPADEEQHFGISIVEPNTHGVIEGGGRDAGVYVEGLGRDEVKDRQIHRLVFWPRTQAPLLLITNAHPTAAAHFGHIRVRKDTSGRLATEAREPSVGDRLVAAYVARPLVPESLGSSGGIDSTATGRAADSVDDWQMFYEGATRLADYLHYGGYNSAAVSVLADGSTIYPSAALMPTPLYNTSRLAAEAPERDGLELLLRVFDREGLALIPAVQFAAPLPQLEEFRRVTDPQTSGLEWVGPDGLTWLASKGAIDGLAPYYNLLDPRVQQAMIQVVRELVARCDEHPSFAGLAIQLSARGYAQLPPLAWGLDDATVGRFQQDTGIKLDASGPERFSARHALLTGEHVDAWRAWRAARVAEFYEKLAKIVREGNDRRRTLITLEESFAQPQLAAGIRPNLTRENRVEAALMDLGINRQLLEKVPGIVICPARFVEPMAPLADRGIALELNQAAALWARKSDPAGTQATLLYHPPQRQPLPSFAAKSPFSTADRMTLIQQPLPYATSVRKPYVEALLDSNPYVLLDGGELLPLGQEDLLRPLRSILRRLPTSAKVTERFGQPVLVRWYVENNRTTLLVVNGCPWHTEADVTLEVDHPAMLEPLVASQAGNADTPSAQALSAGKQPWPLSLAPYAVEAVQIASPGVNVVEVRAEISANGKSELAARLADLANRDLTAPRVFPALINPSFEPLGGTGPVPGWSVAGSGATAELDATAPQDGKTCVYFHPGRAAASLESESFTTPATGQLAMVVFARCQNDEGLTELRMVFEAEGAGQSYRRSFVVGGHNSSAQRLGSQWRPYAILVNDLPLDSKGRMRVRFELTGPGEVWLDNVKLYDLLVPLTFYKKLGGEAEIKQLLILINAAQSAMDAGRIADCLRLVEGYWPRFVTAYTPLVKAPIAVEPAAKPPSPPPADEAQQPAPSIGERIKRFVPFVR